MNGEQFQIDLRDAIGKSSPSDPQDMSHEKRVKLASEVLNDHLPHGLKGRVRHMGNYDRVEVFVERRDGKFDT